MHLTATLTFMSALPLKPNWTYHGRNLLSWKWNEFKWSQLSWCLEIRRREAAGDGIDMADAGLKGYQSQRVEETKQGISVSEKS